MLINKKMPTEQSNTPARLHKVPLSVDLGIALGSACTASICVTPLILTIDKAVIQAAAGTMGLGSALVQGVGNIIRGPKAFFMSFPFWLVWTVYACTYTCANRFDVYNERKNVPATQAAM